MILCEVMKISNHPPGGTRFFRIALHLYERKPLGWHSRFDQIMPLASPFSGQVLLSSVDDEARTLFILSLLYE